MYQSTQAYLKLSSAYCDYLGGIRWSNDDDALVYADGKLFAFFAPVAEFLEGLGSGGRLIPFACVLHWVDLFDNLRKHLTPEVRLLRRVFHETGSPWRNAGALAAVLSAEVPEAVDPPRVEHVCRRLRDRAFPIRWFTTRYSESVLGPPEVPPIGPQEFEQQVFAKLAGYGEDDLRAWLRDGRGRVAEAGKALAREMPRPPSLTGVLAALLTRPRLAGAETYVTQLVGALTLPPRRMAPEELPVGGYADVATRGEVAHLLPSQHGLEDLEFLRRFAERELLFFRREEPPAQSRQEVVVLIDQGVRTWGDVRIVLAAAALALGKHSCGRGLRFLLAATSRGGQSLDPLAADAEALGELVEASDLSLNPGAALEVVLEQPTDALRDVVLLTHPRNLREPDVLAAAHRCGPHDRLFAVALDEEGAAAVCEIRRGAPVTLRQFHVDFVPSVAKPLPPPADVGEPLRPWTGDVEPVPFPFRFGTAGVPTRFEFDANGRWLLTASAGGMLHLWDLHSGKCEVLPRPFGAGANLLSLTATADGFVLAGVQEDRLVAAHLDATRRRCKAFALGPASATIQIDDRYGRDLHTVLLTARDVRSNQVDCHVLDLSRGESINPGRLDSDPRAREGWQLINRVPTRAIVLASPKPGWFQSISIACSNSERLSYVLDELAGTICTTRDGCDAMVYTPTADGKPLLTGATIEEVQAAGQVLAVKARLHDGRLRLLLFHGPDGSLLRDHPFEARKNEPNRFLLSPDGRWLALQRSPRVEVEKVEAPGIQMETRFGGYSAEGRLYLSDRSLLISQGQRQIYWHLVNWSRGPAEFYFERRPMGQTGFGCLAFQEVFRQTAVVEAKAGPLPVFLRYDPQRFLAAAHRDGLWFVLDRYGQVAVLGPDGGLRCMLMALRDHLAAWLPDGSRCGSSVLGLGPETPGARQKLSQALAGRGRSG
jgi:hypothetical protein